MEEGFNLVEGGIDGFEAGAFVVHSLGETREEGVVGGLLVLGGGILGIHGNEGPFW